MGFPGPAGDGEGCVRLSPTELEETLETSVREANAHLPESVRWSDDKLEQAVVALPPWKVKQMLVDDHRRHLGNTDHIPADRLKDFASEENR